MSEAAISIEGLRKVYGSGESEVRAVDGLDVRVERGEVFGLLGPNGAGKTTTVEICEGLVEPTAGEVEVLGMRWGRDDRELLPRLGVTLQSTKFFEKQTVRELLRLFSSFYGDVRDVDEVIALVALEPKANARFKTLSGGQQQRLAVASALVGQPDLLFLDEPTTGLDPQARRQLWEIVRDFQRGGGTVVLTTHYMDEAAQLCDRVMIVDHGKSIALGSPEELVESLGAAHVVEVSGAGIEALVGALGDLPSVHACDVVEGRVELKVEEVHAALPRILDACARGGIELDDLTLRGTTLEDVFVSLTGRHLRDEEAS